ncbi:hypothetical protein [Asaia astilbis]|uniref:hypothetical protein n=1 Tax=Asaia astilbis TaxID=610244 RepID=UPI0004718D8A|nr:hypothetical protein [Asaia astilbis]
MNFKANINTFDVFDTLVARRCVLPTNIFKIMEERLGIANFAVTRIQAEQTLLGNPYNFDDIYCNVAEILNINEDETKKLKNQEITLEIENIIPIKENISKVKDGDILISDMYHTEEVVRSLLDAAGFKKQCALSSPITGSIEELSGRKYLKILRSPRILEIIRMLTGAVPHNSISITS